MPRHKKPKRQGRSAKNTYTMKGHKAGAHPALGMEERREIIKAKALELRIRGYTLHESARILVKELGLKEGLAYTTVDNMVGECLAETETAKALQANNHAALLYTRSEAIIRELFPIILGKVQVARSKVVDGERVEIITECEMEERVKVAAEVRKQMEFQARLYKLGRVGEPGDEEKLNAASLTLLVQNMVTQHIQLPGQPPKAATVLSLSSGDANIDEMDAEAIESERTSI